jgi:hypothetical protein
MTSAIVAERATLGVGLEAPGTRALLAGFGANTVSLLADAGASAWSVDLAAASGACEIPETMSSAAVVDVAAQIGVLNRHCIDSIVPFKNSSALERIASSVNIRIAAAPARLSRQLENKLQLPGIAADAGVCAPQTHVISRRGVLGGDINGLPALEDGWVLQPAIGFAGAGTRPVSTLAALVSALDTPASARADAWKLTRRIEGEPLTVNGVVIDATTVVVAQVARQLTGIAECSGEPLGSCGNEWSIPVPSGTAQDVRRVVERIGLALAHRGYRGGYGVDIIATPEGDAVLIEVNPRITASFGLLNQLQRAAEMVPLIDVHEASWNPAASRDVLSRARETYAAGEPLAGFTTPCASIVCYNRAEQPVTPVRDAPWIMHGEEHEFAADTLDVTRIAPEAALVIPQPSTKAIAPGAELARIYLHGQAAQDTGAQRLRPAVSRMVSRVQRSILGDR